VQKVLKEAPWFRGVFAVSRRGEEDCGEGEVGWVHHPVDAPEDEPVARPADHVAGGLDPTNAFDQVILCPGGEAICVKSAAQPAEE
jgi:hypothetical protein